MERVDVNDKNLYITLRGKSCYKVYYHLIWSYYGSHIRTSRSLYSV